VVLSFHRNLTDVSLVLDEQASRGDRSCLLPLAVVFNLFLLHDAIFFKLRLKKNNLADLLAC
jgi:hypothetical protein